MCLMVSIVCVGVHGVWVLSSLNLCLRLEMDLSSLVGLR
jgi:hypothetical protein